MVYATRSKERSSDAQSASAEQHNPEGSNARTSGRLRQGPAQATTPLATVKAKQKAGQPVVSSENGDTKRRSSSPPPSPRVISGPTVPLYDFAVKIEASAVRGYRLPPFFLAGDTAAHLRTIDAWYGSSISDTRFPDDSDGACRSDRVHVQVELTPEVINSADFYFEGAAAYIAYAVVAMPPTNTLKTDSQVADVFTLGYLIPSAIKDTRHPLSRMDPKLLVSDWIRMYGEVVLARPASAPSKTVVGVSVKEEGASQDDSFSVLGAFVSGQTLGLLTVEVGLEPIALQYGFEDDAASGYIDNSVDVRKSLGKSWMLARAMKLALSAIVDWKGSFIEIDTEQNTYWDRNESYYDLPPKQSTLARHKRVAITQSVDSLATSPAKRKKSMPLTIRGNYDKGTGENGGPRPLEKPKLGILPRGDIVTPADLGDTSKETYLPPDTNIASLLEACRPPADCPALHPPPEMIVTPLLRYQARCLHWMVQRESVLDEDVEQLMPNWIPLRTKSAHQVFAMRKELEIERHALLDSIAVGHSVPRKKVQQKIASMKKSANIPDQDDDTSKKISMLQREPFIGTVPATFYYDQISGMLSPRRFHCRPSEPGGALCESMGLGKTLEILSLIATRPRPSISDLLSYDQSRSAQIIQKLKVKPLTSRATLVVCPAALVEQWMDEIKKHYRCRQQAAGLSEIEQGVVRYRHSDFAWDTKTTREAVRSMALTNFVSPDIIVTTYEELAAQLAASNKADKLGLEVRTPLLEVLFWRIVLDEAQIVAGAASRATQMVHELWRSNCWMVTGTPVTKGIKDIQGIFAFLDHDPFASVRAFQNVIQDPFVNGDLEGIRRLRAILPRYVWRHTKAHINSEIELPPTSAEVLEIKLTQVERLFYDKEVKRYQDEFAKRAYKGIRETGQTDFLVNLRQLLSHPQIADQLHFFQGISRLSFVELFIRFCQKADAELESERMQVVTCILQLVWGHDFYDEERNKQRWTGGKKVLTNAKSIQAMLELGLTIASRALKDNAKEEEIVDGQEHNTDRQATPTTDTKSQAQLGWEEARYWLRMLAYEHRGSSAASKMPEPPAKWDPERPTRVFFEKAFKSVNDPSVNMEDPRFHLIVQDAGVDDMDEDELMAQIDAARAETEAAAGASSPSADLDARPQKRQKVLEPGLLKKSRLRGNASQRQEGRVWYYKPRERLENTATRLERLKAVQETKEHEAAFLREKLKGIQQESRTGTSKGGVALEGRVECMICFDVKTEVGVLPCYHAYCMDCVESICQPRGDGKCPLCRKSFRSDSVTRTSQVKLDPKAEDAHTVLGDWGAKITGLITDFKARLKDDTTHKAVIFSHWKKMLAFSREALVQNGVPTVVFGGGEEAQAAALRGIRDDPTIKVILVPLRASAGAAGLTLTSCDIAYLMEPALDGALEAQAIGRIHRIGQTRPTTVIRVKVKDTVEDAVMRIAEQRAKKGIKLALSTSTEVDPEIDTTSATPESETVDKGESSTQLSLRAKSIASSLGSSVGVARDTDATRLTAEEIAMILNISIRTEDAVRR